MSQPTEPSSESASAPTRGVLPTRSETASLIQVETAKRLRRERVLRSPEERVAIARQRQIEAYRLMRSNPNAWQAFRSRNHAKRAISRVDARDPGRMIDGTINGPGSAS